MQKKKVPRTKENKLNSLRIGRKLTIAIDIDGTIADCSAVDFSKVDMNPNELLKAKPKKEALLAIKQLYKQGHKIVFFSSRNKGSMLATKKWLNRHGFPYHDIELEKLVAHLYIDDRAINGSNWKLVLEQIKNPNLPGTMARKRGRL